MVADLNLTLMGNIGTELFSIRVAAAKTRVAYATFYQWYQRGLVSAPFYWRSGFSSQHSDITPLFSSAEIEVARNIRKALVVARKGKRGRPLGSRTQRKER
jgi:hypothetical protein